MLNCFFTESTGNIIPIRLVSQKKYAEWVLKQPEINQSWLSATQFKAENSRADLYNNVRLLPTKDGKLAEVFCCVMDTINMWDVGSLASILPEGNYQFDIDETLLPRYACAWGLGAYQFTRYKKRERQPAKLYLPKKLIDEIENIVSSIYLVRDWINTPTDDMGPTEFADVAAKLAEEFNASFTEIVGEDLLTQNYASIYTVGRASDDPPRLIDIRWGLAKHPKVTLVGKGVCFDSGGLDIKSSPHMLLMKKDMAGGAHVLGLARMIMQAKLPINLRVLIPMVENVIAGNAYRPGDIIKSRKGLTIEIGNTDAEGRVILADALAEAVSEKPELVIDISTLTGAARIALGTEVPVVFCNNDTLFEDVNNIGNAIADPMWRLPLFTMYREYLSSFVADINNSSSDPFGGAITAALFLKEFISDDIPWMHFDMMAWNTRARPGRPVGGEAFMLRTLFTYLKTKYRH